MSEESHPSEVVTPATGRLRRKYVLVGAFSVVGLLLMGWLGCRWWIGRLQADSRLAAESRDWKTLENSAREWTRWQPGETEAWVLLAESVQQQQRFPEAAAYLANVPSDAPGYVDAQVARSQLFFGPCNQPLQGETQCLQILSEHAEVPSVYGMLIDYYAITMQRDRLRETIRQAIEVQCEPRSAYAYLFMSETMRLGPAYRIVSLWLNDSPDNELLKVAHALQKEDRIVQARKGETRDRDAPSEKVQRVRQLLKEYPGNLNLISYEIDDRVIDGDIDAVIDLLDAAGEAGLGDNRMWRHRAWVHLTGNEFEAAESACRSALELHPQDFLAMQMLSEVARILKKPDEATRLQQLVLTANGLRDRITDHGSMTTLPEEVMRQLEEWSRAVGDIPVADALDRRLGAAGGQNSGKAK